MVDKKDEDPYRNFSRKDLQILCKKYGLPANKSNSEMATSLILYLEKKNLSSPSKCKGSKDNPPSSSASQLNLGGGVISTRPSMKGSFSDGAGSDRSYPQDVQQRDSMNRAGAVTSDKVPREVENLPELRHPNGNVVACRPHAFSSILSSVEVPTPTFKFDVSCEDGIQLFVDLITSPSDWVQSMKSGVEIYPALSNDKPESVQQEFVQLSCSKKTSLQNNIDPDHKINDIAAIDQSEPASTLKESGLIETEDGREIVTLSAPTPEPSSNNVGRVENSGKDQLILSSKHGSDAKKEDVCRSETWKRDGESMSIFSHTNNVSQFQSPRQLGLSSSLDGLRCSGMLEHPSLKLDTCHNLSKQTYSCVNQCVKLTGSPTTFSMKTQLPSIRPQSKDTCYLASENVGFVRFADQVQNFEASQGVLADAPARYQDASGLRYLKATDHVEGPFCSHIMNGGSWDRVHMKRSVNSDHRGSLTFNKLNQDNTNFNMSITNVLSKRTSVTHGVRPGFSDPYSHGFSVQREPDQLMNSTAVDRNMAAMQVAASKARDPSSSFCISAENTGFNIPKQSLEMKQTALNHPTELNKVISKKHPTVFEEKWDVRNAANEREISEYYSSLMDNTCLRSDDLVSNEGLKRNREFNNVDDRNKFVCHDANMLRSSNHFTRDINACPRRVTRFYSE